MSKQKKGKGLRIFLIFILIAVLFNLAFPSYILGKSLASTIDYPPLNFGENSTVYGSDGSTLGIIQAAGKGESSLKGDQISPLLRHAFLAIEDRGFYEHSGVSFWSMAKATLFNVEKGSFAAGGSTISQQYVKNAYLSREKTLDRYQKGVRLAYKLENDYSKDEILERYINSNYYGKGAVGIDDAAQAWFGHSATQITDVHNPEHVAKAAFLAALVQQPGTFEKPDERNPTQLKNINALKKRQVATLDGFREVKGVKQQDKVPSDVIEKAKQVALNVDAVNKKPKRNETTLDPYLLAYIKDWLAATEAEAAKQLDDRLNDQAATEKGQEQAKALLAQGGLKIYTTINPKLQALLPKAVGTGNGKLTKRGLSIGSVIMDPATGAVAAIYGGADFAKDGNNYALYADRQPGSTMKTVVLADLVSKGISPMSVLPAPACIKLDKDNPEQCNDNKRPGSETCKLSLADATALSNNPVFLEAISGKMADCGDPVNPAKLSPISKDYQVSPQSVADLARKMGADDSTVPAKNSPAKLDPVPSLALGTSSLTPLKLASIGSTLADGTHNKPFIIQKITTGESQRVAYENAPQAQPVLDPKHVAVINQVLTGVYTKGTAKQAGVPGHPLAGKTGTTATDAWMLAWSASDPNKKAPSYVCSIWAGYADNRTTSDKGGDLWGADVAQVCKAFFTDALAGVDKVDFPPADLNVGKKVGLK